MPKFAGFPTLCAAPEGTIFSTYTHEVAGLYRKGKSLPTSPFTADHYGGPWSDFYYHTLLAEPEGHDEPPVAFNEPLHGGRWGNLDPEEKFIIYDAEDVRKMQTLLQPPTPACTCEGKGPDPGDHRGSCPMNANTQYFG